MPTFFEHTHDFIPLPIVLNTISWVSSGLYSMKINNLSLFLMALTTFLVIQGGFLFTLATV